MGNYWSDYDGSDADGDGVGNAPYLLQTTYYDHAAEKNVTLLSGQDNYPPMTPFTISTLVNPTVAPSKTPSAGSNSPDPFPVAVVLVVVVLVVFGVGLAVFFRAHRRGASSSAPKVDFGLVKKC